MMARVRGAPWLAARGDTGGSPHADRRAHAGPLHRREPGPEVALLGGDRAPPLSLLRRLQPHVHPWPLRRPRRGVLADREPRGALGRRGRALPRDQRARRLRLREPPHAARPRALRGRTGEVRRDHRRRRWDRERPGAAAPRREPLLAGARRQRRAALGARSGRQLGPGRAHPRGRRLAPADPGPEVARRDARRLRNGHRRHQVLLDAADGARRDPGRGLAHRLDGRARLRGLPARREPRRRALGAHPGRGQALRDPPHRAVGPAPDGGRHLQLRLRHDAREQPLRGHGPRAAGGGEGGGLRREAGARAHPRAGRRAQARGDRARGRPARHRARGTLAGRERGPQRRARHERRLLAAAAQEHRLRLGADRARAAGHPASRSAPGRAARGDGRADALPRPEEADAEGPGVTTQRAMRSRVGAWCAAFALAALLGAALPARGGEAQPADLALTGGAVYTLDPARSWAQAVAIRGGRIVYVGSDAGIAAFIGPKTRVVALTGRMLLPGFQDAHVHPVSGGYELTLCDLNDLPTRAAVVEKVRACAAQPRGEWLVGGGWALPIFPGGNPDRALLDELSPKRPAYLSAADGHSAWVNSRALALAKIDAKTPDPPNGRIERDPKSGEPTGTLRESAADLVENLLPKPTPAELEAGLRRALAYLNRLGITAVQEASADRPGLEAYRAMERRGELSLRVVAALGTATIAEELPPEKRADPAAIVASLVALRSEFASPRIRPTAAKIFADGVIEARTAAMLEPYLDRPGFRGEPNYSPEQLDALVAALVRQGFSVHIHAIGDRAVRISLDALEAAGARRGAGSARHQLAHIEVIQAEDMPRFRTLGVIANFQPLWAYADPYIIDLTLPALAPETVRRIYPIGSAERAGAPIAFGSDWSVTSPDPLSGIQVAVTRQGLDGKPEPFLPDEAIRLDTALAAYTIGSAYALGIEAETGSIEVGKLADLVVLSHDLFALPPGRIASAKVLLTLLEGEPVFRDAAFAWDARGRPGQRAGAAVSGGR